MGLHLLHQVPFTSLYILYDIENGRKTQRDRIYFINAAGIKTGHKPHDHTYHDTTNRLYDKADVTCLAHVTGGHIKYLLYIS